MCVFLCVFSSSQQSIQNILRGPMRSAPHKSSAPIIYRHVGGVALTLRLYCFDVSPRTQQTMCSKSCDSSKRPCVRLMYKVVEKVSFPTPPIPYMPALLAHENKQLSINLFQKKNVGLNKCIYVCVYMPPHPVTTFSILDKHKFQRRPTIVDGLFFAFVFYPLFTNASNAHPIHTFVAKIQRNSKMDQILHTLIVLTKY